MTSSRRVAVEQIASSTLPHTTVLLNKTIMNSLKIPENEAITLQFGALQQTIKVASASKHDNLRLHPELAEKLGLYAPHTLKLRYDAKTTTLYIGPLLAILISRVDEQNKERPFGKMTTFCEELTIACKRLGGAVYFMTPQQLKQNYNSVQGIVLDHEQHWRTVTMPVPDIINNRLTSRKLENNPSVQQFIREVNSRHGTAFFNEKFLDKSDVFDALAPIRSLTAHLPQSLRLTTRQQLHYMCARHRVVFLKPARGSLGKGIIRIERLNEKLYVAQFTSLAGIRKQPFTNISALWLALKSKVKLAKYQIQQGLALIEIGGRPVDFRAVVQKNETGRWIITSIVARQASPQQFVSNIARGGSLFSVKDALARSRLTPLQRRQAMTKLNQVALEIAEHIDATINAHFGELGIDLAVDNNGKVWLIEVNSKPSKNDNTPMPNQKVRPSVRNFVRYATFLAKF